MSLVAVVVNDVGGVEHAFLDEKGGGVVRYNIHDQQDYGGDRSPPNTIHDSQCPSTSRAKSLKKILSPEVH